MQRIQKEAKKWDKGKKTALVGDVMDPLHYYFIYAKPKATDKNCIGFVAVGAGIQVINENYNSEWAEILWGNYSVGYIKRIVSIMRMVIWQVLNCGDNRM